MGRPDGQMDGQGRAGKVGKVLQYRMQFGRWARTYWIDGTRLARVQGRGGRA